MWLGKQERRKVQKSNHVEDKDLGCGNVELRKDGGHNEGVFM